MTMEQEKEWAEAQKIELSIDLVTASKNQVKFLAVVDRNRFLYKGPAMEWAIYRYNAYWLPLLAKHMENPLSDDPIVVPLDCEWIWHCHRLSPVKYKSDCEKLFGKVLGNHNIISSIHGTSKTKTKEIWNKMYPEEPYELDPDRQFPDISQNSFKRENFTDYDLVSAVGRKVSFYYQVSKPHVLDDLFLQEAVARYKGFLHIIKTNKKNNVQLFCVPTYDVDLIWHSHQLDPISYHQDLIKLLGSVMNHDDTDTNKGKGSKLDTSFFATTKQYEETFGLNYWKAGGMSRGTAPTPVVEFPIPFIYEGEKFHTPNTLDDLKLSLQQKRVIEVMLEFMEIKNLPEGYKENLRVLFSKKQPDVLFNAKGALTILSDTREKQVAIIQCEPTREFLFELAQHLPSESYKPFGHCSLSLEECFDFKSQLFINKWISVDPIPELLTPEPILLHVSLSFTPPTSAPKVFRFLHFQPCYKCSSCSPLPKIDNANNTNGQTRVYYDGNAILNIQMRDLTKGIQGLVKEVIHITKSGETHTLAKFQENEWVIEGSHGSLQLRCAPENDGHLFELVGEKMIRLFAGRKLDYQAKENEKKRGEEEFMTVVEFSAEYPYGRAVALIDFGQGILKVMDEWMILAGITLTIILLDVLRREGRFTSKLGYEDIISIQANDSTDSTSNIIEAEAMEFENSDKVNDEPRKLVSQGAICENVFKTKGGIPIDRGVNNSGNNNGFRNMLVSNCAPCCNKCVDM